MSSHNAASMGIAVVAIVISSFVQHKFHELKIESLENRIIALEAVESRVMESIAVKGESVGSRLAALEALAADARMSAQTKEQRAVDMFGVLERSVELRLSEAEKKYESKGDAWEATGEARLKSMIAVYEEKVKGLHVTGQARTIRQLQAWVMASRLFGKTHEFMAGTSSGSSAYWSASGGLAVSGWTDAAVEHVWSDSSAENGKAFGAFVDRGGFVPITRTHADMGGSTWEAQRYEGGENLNTLGIVIRGATPLDDICALNGNLYAFGRGAAEMYVPKTNTWLAIQAPFKRFADAVDSFSVAVLGGRIYAVGGRLQKDSSTEYLDSKASQLAAVDVYDPKADSWSAVASMASARRYPGVGSVDGKLYVIGGAASKYRRGAAADCVKHNEMYDPATNVWLVAAPMPHCVTSVRVAELNSKLYVVGTPPREELESRHGHAPMPWTSLMIYDPKRNMWSEGTNLTTFRSFADVAALNGRLFVVGGLSVTSFPEGRQDGYYTEFKGVASSSVEMYDPATKVWTASSSMTTNRSFARVAALNGKLYVLGGSAFPEVYVGNFILRA